MSAGTATIADAVLAISLRAMQSVVRPAGMWSRAMWRGQPRRDSDQDAAGSITRAAPEFLRRERDALSSRRAKAYHAHIR